MPPSVRFHHCQRRHLDGHRRVEIPPSPLRSHGTTLPSATPHSVNGVLAISGCDKEHARRKDCHCPHEHPSHIRLQWNDEARRPQREVIYSSPMAADEDASKIGQVYSPWTEIKKSARGGLFLFLTNSQLRNPIQVRSSTSAD